MLGKSKQQSKKILSALSIVIALSSLGLTTSTAYSEVLNIPDAPQSFSVTLPGRGMTMTKVLENFGEPQSKDPEVGQPPITRWHYPNYIVVFEYQYVIHALTTNKPMGLMQPQSDVPTKESETMPMDKSMDADTQEMPATH